MFQRKTKKVTVPSVTTKRVSVPTLAGLKKQVAEVAADAAKTVEVAAHKADERAHAAADSAAKEASASAQAVRKATHDKVDETVPKITDSVERLLAAGSAASHDVAERVASEARKGQKLVADEAKKGKEIVTGEKKKKERRKKGILRSLFSALVTAAAAAGVVAYLRSRQQEPKDDPWARPLTDPYIAPATKTADVSSAPAPSTTAKGEEVAQSDLADTPPVDAAEVEVVDLTTEPTTVEGESRNT